jgi:hypothetical protein
VHGLSQRPRVLFRLGLIKNTVIDIAVAKAVQLQRESVRGTLLRGIYIRAFRIRFLDISVPRNCLACSKRSRFKSTRTCFLKIQPRRKSAQHSPDALLYNVSLYPLFVRAAMVDRESSMHTSRATLSRLGIELAFWRSAADDNVVDRLIHCFSNTFTVVLRRTAECCHW